MSPLKRKQPPGGDPPAKIAKASKESRPSKPKSSTKNQHVSPDESRTSAPAISRLVRQDEPMFPRGGGSVLTPLEQRDIGRQARTDAFLEASRPQADDEFGVPENGPDGKSKAKAKGKKGKAGRKLRMEMEKEAEKEETVKIQSLNFKNLVKGSLVLGQIVAIRAMGLVVALPNHLTGYVSIVTVSDQVTRKLEQEAAGMDASGDEEDDEEEEDRGPVDLKELFHVGQYVRASVLSTGNATDKDAKHRIELSLRPADANTGLTADDLIANSMLMASVISKEDHGCVMDLGIAGADLKGFLSTRQIDPAIGENRLQPGAVMLCMVTKKASEGKIAQLSTVQEKMGSVKSVAADANSINTFLPGTLAEMIVSAVSGRGLVGKIIGHLDATADVVHSGAGPSQVNLEEKYKVGSRVKARVVCNFPAASEPKVGVSLLPHVISLLAQRTAENRKSKEAPADPLAVLPISSFVDKCTVGHVEGSIGLYVDVGVPGVGGFVHISGVKDGKVDALYESSGPFRVGSVHRGRVVGYSAVDGMFYLSFRQSVLDQKYLRLEDVPVGTVVSGTVRKLVLGENGVSGIIVDVCDGISGFVNARHLADVQLQRPEIKFREGLVVKARVLSVDLIRRQMRLTLKNTLVRSEAPVIKSLEDAAVGMQAPGTIVKVQDNGARVRFYAGVQAWLPVSEMSEAYVHNPADHFRAGQVVNVHVIEANRDLRRLIVSCKDPTALGLEKQVALAKLRVGDVVSATVTEKTEDKAYVELADSGLRAVLPMGHLSDRSAGKTRTKFKGLYVGQTLSDLMVIGKNVARRYVVVTQKPSLMLALKEGTLISEMEDAHEGRVVQGFVGNFTPSGIVVSLGGSLHGLLPVGRLAQDVQAQENFGMAKYQPVKVMIRSVDRERKRMFFSLPPATNGQGEEDKPRGKKFEGAVPAVNPADEAVTRLEDVKFGMVVKARIHSVKDTQLNMRLADNIQGRVDVSQVYDRWEDIANPRKPLQKFRPQQIIPVRVLGVHDARHHKFLPFSHRTANSVLELSAKPGDVGSAPCEPPLSLDGIEIGSTHTVFVNNSGPGCLWVNLSPSVRGRIQARDATKDLSLLRDLSKSFPVGSALRARATAVDPGQGRLDLAAENLDAEPTITWDTVEKNMVLPARVAKVTDNQVVVGLSETLAAPIGLPDLSDNYDEVGTLKHEKNEIIRVSVVSLDKSNKKMRLSTRQSRVLSSGSAVADPEIRDASQISAGDVIRGFVKNVSDKGLFVLLGGPVTALVKITNLFDRFVKDWKEEFRVDQLVRGRVISVDPATKQVEMSLKPSALSENYVPLKTYADMKKGRVVTGRVRKVEDFGAFVVVDGTDNVSGLCHRSQMADAPVTDAKKLYSEGDAVKAFVLSVNAEKKRLSLGLKPSLFDDDGDTDMSDGGAVLEVASDDEDESDAGLPPPDVDDMEVDDKDDDTAGEDDGGDDARSEGLAISDSEYDWTADVFAHSDKRPREDNADGAAAKKSSRRKKGDIEVDRTAELDVNGPQISGDYERLLLGQPDSSALWIAYMAFQMQVADLSEARKVAERAVRAINIREETEKLNVWIAFLNLEVAYGSKGSEDEVFQRACQYNDSREVHERLVSIYIQSGKHKAADSLFMSMLKKFGSSYPDIWLNYAHFLHATLSSPDRARALLPRATQALDARHHLAVLTRFAALEFRSPNGEPERGRTMFAGLLDKFPRKGDLWSQLLDLEMGALASAPPESATEKAGSTAEAREKSRGVLQPVRDVFERRTKARGLKPKQALKWFERWADWEEKVTGAKGRERIVAKTQEWVRAYKVKKDSVDDDV